LPWVSPDLESKAFFYILFFEFSPFFKKKKMDEIKMDENMKYPCCRFSNFEIMIAKPLILPRTSKGVSKISPNIYILQTPFIFIIYLFFHYVMT
jgi:hypothetical protein